MSATRSRSLRRLWGGPEFANTRGPAVRARRRCVPKGGRSDPDHLGGSTGSGLTVAHLLEQGAWLRGALKPNPTLGSRNCSTSDTCPPAPERPPIRAVRTVRQPGPGRPWTGGRGNALPVWSSPARTRGSALSVGSLRRFSEHTPGSGGLWWTRARGGGTHGVPLTVSGGDPEAF